MDNLPAALATGACVVGGALVAWKVYSKRTAQAQLFGAAECGELPECARSCGAVAKRSCSEWARPKKVAADARPTQRIVNARANSEISFADLTKQAEELRASGGDKRWRDEDFPPEDESLFEDPENPPTDWLRDGERGRPIHGAVVSWRRPEEFCVTKRPMGKRADGKPTWLYADDDSDKVATSLDVTADDVLQGSLGDCYLLAAIAAAARDMGLADDLIDETFEDVGIYGVSFHVNGRWEMVWVDECFPCYRPKASSHSGRWRLVFASCKDPKEIWPLVVEKAYAKLHGNYQALSGGRVVETLCALTGGKGSQMSLRSPFCSAGGVFSVCKDVKAQAAAGTRFVGAGTRGDMDDGFAMGIVTGHAYTVQDAYEADGLRLLKLRNPWGRSEWKGDWSDGSRRWRDEEGRAAAKALGDRESGDDGEFWISVEDFMARFVTLDFCDVAQDGREARLKALRESLKREQAESEKDANAAKVDERSIDDLLAEIEGKPKPSKKKKKKHHKHH